MRLTGRVVVKTWSKVGTKQMASFYQLVRQAYPWATRIRIIQVDLPALRQQILSFFQPYEVGSLELLSSVGLHLP